MIKNKSFLEKAIFLSLLSFCIGNSKTYGSFLADAVGDFVNGPSKLNHYKTLIDSGVNDYWKAKHEAIEAQNELNNIEENTNRLKSQVDGAIDREQAVETRLKHWGWFSYFSEKTIALRSQWGWVAGQNLPRKISLSRVVARLRETDAFENKRFYIKAGYKGDKWSEARIWGVKRGLIVNDRAKTIEGILDQRTSSDKQDFFKDIVVHKIGVVLPSIPKDFAKSGPKERKLVELEADIKEAIRKENEFKKK